MSKDDDRTTEFGHADREPSPDEEQAAEQAEMGEETAEKYEEMARTGAESKGEGRITPD